MLLIRDLGLDILNLKPIDHRTFKKNDIIDTYTFERHHIYINDKFSIDVNRLVLVMRMNHTKLEGKTALILDLIKSRINLTTECPQYYRKNIKDWKTKWLEYLERRKYLLEHGIAKFINDYFRDNDGKNYLLNRFFNNLSEDQIELEIKKMIQEWIQKGRPAPIINSHVWNQLFTDSPTPLPYDTVKFNF